MGRLLMGERSNRHESLGDFLFGELGRAFDDIRAKLVDEGWFGRRTGAPGQVQNPSLGWEREGCTIGPSIKSFEEQWAPREAAPERDPPSGLEIDR